MAFEWYVVKVKIVGFMEVMFAYLYYFLCILILFVKLRQAAKMKNWKSVIRILELKIAR